jgi:hypothetical protein
MANLYIKGSPEAPCCEHSRTIHHTPGVLPIEAQSHKRQDDSVGDE